MKQVRDCNIFSDQNSKEVVFLLQYEIPVSNFTIFAKQYGVELYLTSCPVPCHYMSRRLLTL